MKPKTLLIVIGDGHALDPVEQSMALAKAAEANLSVAVVGIAPPPPTSIYNVVPMDAWSEEREEGMDSLRAQGEKVSQLLAETAVSGDVSLHYCDEAQIETVVGRRGRCADLAIGIRGETAYGRLWRRSLSGLLFRSARPFLLVPEGSKASLSPTKIMIAWNSSREAARAVYDSIDILAAAKAVHVVMIDPLATEEGDGEEPGNDLATYLAHHDVNVTVDVISAAGRDTHTVLLNHANDIDAGMIIMGAYGHSRLFEQIFGGTTQAMLDNADRPVLMAH